MQTCQEMVDDALAKLWLDGFASKDFKNFKKREPTTRFATFEKMGEMIDQQKHEQEEPTR